MSVGCLAQVGAAKLGTLGFDEPGELQDRLARLREEFKEHGQVEFRAVVEGTSRALRPEADRVVKGVCREALSNVYRHANASCVELELVYRRRDLRVVVRDNGVGISSERASRGVKQGRGLSQMKERAEGAGVRLRVLSQAGGGTEIEMTVPGTIAFAQAASAGWLSRIYFAREQEYV